MSEVHALLVEGVPGIGKSTVIDAMIRRHVASADKTRIRTLLHLSQTWIDEAYQFWREKRPPLAA
jgi:MoxR-like ATPase